jgi:CBS domain-containing protein
LRSNKGYDVFSVSPGDTVLKVLQLFSNKKIGFAVVGNLPDDIMGTISERDICHALSHSPGISRADTIKKVMTKNILYCDVEDSLTKVMAIMTGCRSRHVLVREHNNFIGIISIGDVVKYRLDESLHEEEDLRKYIHGTGYNYAG